MDGAGGGRDQLADGRDVLVPQFLGRLNFVLELEDLCRQVGAEFVEWLVSDPQEVVDQFCAAPPTRVPRRTGTLTPSGSAAAASTSYP